MNRLFRLLSAGAFATVAQVASADVIYTFTAAGVTEDVAQQGTAIFDFSNDASTLTITLFDNVVPTSSIASEISGLQFAFTVAPTAMALTSASAPLVIDCTNVSGPSCPSANGAPPQYGWGSTMSGNLMTLGAGYSNGTFGFQPFDIVNQNYLAAGLGDSANNPLLVGPVSFTFALQGLPFIPEVSATTFMFGDPILLSANPIPEPGSIGLLGIALIAAVVVGGFVGRNRSK